MKGKKRKIKKSIIFILISILLIENLAPVSNLVYANGTYNKLVSNLLSTAENKDNMSASEVEDEPGDTTTSEPENQEDMDEVVGDNKPVDETIDEESPPKEDDTNDGEQNKSEDETTPPETENQEDTNEALPIDDGNTEDNTENVDTNSSGITYIVKYHHADGSIDFLDANGNVKPLVNDTDETFPTLKEGQEPIVLNPRNNAESGEKYSGTTISAGHSAVDLVETTDEVTGDITTATITYNTQEHLVKINFYYKKPYVAKIPVTGGTVDEKNGDATDDGTNKIYDTSRPGLHTDKTAKVTSHTDLNDGRTFDITLESWNVNNIADIGMILDASGSMVWSAEDLKTDDKKYIVNVKNKGYTGNYPQKDTPLSPQQVNQILDVTMTDNSKLSYNGYKYYVYEIERPTVMEYVPLGYGYLDSDGNIIMNDDGFIADDEDMNGKSGNPGWYYVNSSNKNKYVTNGTAKQYKRVQYCNTGTEFYIDEGGYLYCKFQGGDNAETSYVYEKPDESKTKSEVLQHSIAKFISKINTLAPDSKIGMTRFSSKDFNNNKDLYKADLYKLVLLNWTDNPITAIAAMNLAYNDTDKDDDKNDEYNYGHTGGTSTISGFNSFNILNGRLGNTGHKKYVILFTDGKDTDIFDAKTDQEREANRKNLLDTANDLKAKGYTIFTVMMQSAGIEGDDAKELLKEIASKRNDTEQTPYYWQTTEGDYDSLEGAFSEIANEIGGDLTGYTVQDYIDPRFDLLHKKDGKVEVATVKKYINQPITLLDDKEAILRYDTAKDMYYLQWTNQTIPSTTKGSRSLDVWPSTITLRAKEDFIGGNNILTNGNEANMNYVFHPSGTGSSGTDNCQDKPYPSKGFPRTTVNPELLDLDIDDTQDTIFLGEYIDPTELEKGLEKTVDSKYYIEYLDRYDKYFKTNEKQTLLKGTFSETTVEVPYYYLPACDKYYQNGTVMNETGTGTDNHQKDRIGTLTYQWIAYDKYGNELKLYDKDNHELKLDDEFNTAEIVSIREGDTRDIYYKLKITYTPKTIDERDTYNTTLNKDTDDYLYTGYKGITNIKVPVGTKQEEIDEVGEAHVHIVSGEIVIQKKVKKVELEEYLNELSKEEFKFVLSRSCNDDLDWDNKRISITIPLSQDGESLGEVTEDRDYIILTSDRIINLPIGTYTVTEETENNEYYTFDTIKVNGINDYKYACRAEVENEKQGIFHIGYGYEPNTSTTHTGARRGVATFTNKLEGSITINKKDDKGDELEGVKFKLEKAEVMTDEEGKVMTDEDGNEIWKSNGVVEKYKDGVTTGQDGVAKFEGLPIGKYILTEVKTTQGHNLLAKPVNITIPFEYDADDIVNGNPVTEGGIAFDLTYTITNNAVFNLPTSGGSGIASHYLIAGAILIVLSVSLLSIYIYRKNRAKGQDI